MDAQQLQQHIDALALVQAQKELNLTDEQQPTFAAKLTRLQNVRRRQTNERRRIFMELRPLLDSQPAKEDAITERLNALKEVNRRSAEEIVKAYDELDALLTPWQRARFRLFEERLERTKVDLLARLNAGNRAGGSKPK
jgi:Spy/CpxP family protein refolding chaperone